MRNEKFIHASHVRLHTPSVLVRLLPFGGPQFIVDVKVTDKSTSRRLCACAIASVWRVAIHRGRQSDE